MDERDGSFDERRLWRVAAQALPVLTIGVAVVVAVLVGPSLSLLVIAAGLLLAVIALLWTSLRILSGDVSIAPELEALDMTGRGVDVLATRKKMLLRALKDLDIEHGLGKL